jgi:hypothetical protein
LQRLRQIETGTRRIGQAESYFNPLSPSSFSSSFVRKQIRPEREKEERERGRRKIDCAAVALLASSAERPAHPGMLSDIAGWPRRRTAV